MALVIRMKNVTRSLLFVGSLMLWVVFLSLLNESFLKMEEYALLVGAVLLSVAQTWVLALMLRT